MHEGWEIAGEHQEWGLWAFGSLIRITYLYLQGLLKSNHTYIAFIE